jgi:ABC-type transport system involved in Fe-S cluster assembly fused permease/ATPase subunit
MWDLWWTKWHWDRFFPEYFGFPLSISFDLCSITQKNEKRNLNHLHHNKPPGCVASVASAEGPFTKQLLRLILAIYEKV